MRSYIPTINISPLLKTDFSSLSAINTIKKIEKACVDVGFFQITGHGINKKKNRQFMQNREKVFQLFRKK